MTHAVNGNEIAIIGIAGRFPGAESLEELWQNLCDGVESIATFTDEELAARGVPEHLRRDPRFVKAAASLRDPALFDAAFFGYTPREAELIDPQQRAFLECAWEALEDAGHAPAEQDVLVGVFGGAALSSYLVFNLLSNPALLATLDPLQVNLGNANSFLTTRASYKLDLKGPSFNVESACSTSLVAVHVACQSLLNHECDLALAGGVSINLSVQHGYRYIEGSILSPDGRCRPFDEGASGIVFGSGAGVVALRRLEDAIADGDPIYAVIRGSAVNNDGALRAGYTAPGVAGQTQVITEALANADVPAETIGYVEAHGTGTALGDPIEIQALTRAYREQTEATRFCAIGSLKANIGHLDAASGVAGLIKATLALQNRLLPPSIHCETPNPAVAWETTPFHVCTALTPWEPGATPRRAGVSSFGMGGTNAHVILEEPPPRQSEPPARDRQVLVLSAKSEAALDAMTARLARHLRRHPDTSVADLAYTLQIGRQRLPHRRALLCEGKDAASAAAALEDAGRRAFTGHEERAGRPVVFMFPGQGAQHVRMGARLYASEPVFRRHIDEGAAILRPLMKQDPRELLYPGADPTDASRAAVDRTELAQPLLFLVEHALAQTWMSWGVKPAAMIGHSVGEYVAACLSGVMSLGEALALVVARGRLMQSLPPGAMLSVNLPEAELSRLIEPPLGLAAVNGPSLCVASGPVEAIADLERRLGQRGVGARRLRTSHAYHSPLLEPIVGPFAEQVRRVRLSAPRLPWVSNVTGAWITAQEAQDPAYWVRHLCKTVRFAAGLELLAERRDRVLLEVGPGRALSTIARQQPAFAEEGGALHSLPSPTDPTADDVHLFETLGRLWIAGVDVDFRAVHAGARRQRLSLPTYPFERRRYWIEPAAAAPSGLVPAAPLDAAAEPLADAAAPASSHGSHPRPRLRTAFVAPRTDRERAVARIWQEVLGIDEVGVDDNFFELGGHSLLATAVIGRLRETFGLEVPLQLLFEAQTVASMAEVVGSLQGSAGGDDPRISALLARLAELAEGDPTDV
ncbi:beta-ketoacyl synthase N-terminal-like domain-containing protein [Sorangium sp. So ce726]|uniref:type I polyketide synthase n=1 Tax=Sorangium sp. So ce726 TaxID=3133319 RepID=UPI003F61BEF1